MKIFLYLFIMLAVAAAGWFGWRYFTAPPAPPPVAQEAPKPKPTPPPDLGLPAFEAAAKEAATADPVQAAVIWRTFLQDHARSAKAPEARALLGELNARILFSATPSEEKSVYTVVKGDSLAKIAARNGSNAELLLRANNLTGTMLQIGQQLLIPKTSITGVVDTPRKTLTLLNNGIFFKDYALLALKLPAGSAGPREGKVSESLATVDGKRVAFGDKKYPLSNRIILTSIPGFTIQTAPEGAAPDSFAPGATVSVEDMEEIFVLLTRGSALSIR